MKFVRLLVVFFAGFATAIYCLAPVPDSQQTEGPEKAGIFWPALKSDDFAQSFNIRMHKCIDVGGAFAAKAGVYIKDKINEVKTDS